MAKKQTRSIAGRGPGLPYLRGTFAAWTASRAAGQAVGAHTHHRAAPGAKVHESGVPWDDRSGDRLRDWLAIDRETFYDDRQVAIVPMGFCYPGRDKNGGDSPPRPECAPQWHPALLPALKGVTLTLLVGSYAQAHYLGKRRGRTMTETVHRWQEYLPQYLPTPHPSWRTTGWARKNPWFETPNSCPPSAPTSRSPWPPTNHHWGRT